MSIHLMSSRKIKRYKKGVWNTMKVLFITSESVPFAKTGGLADVSFALPKALKKEGADISVIMPFYKNIADEYKEKMEFVEYFDVKMNWRNQYAGILKYNLDGVIYYFIDNEYYFKRDGHSSSNGYYGCFDDGERFSFFNKAVIDFIVRMEVKPDIIHANDWHSGMVSLLLKDQQNNGRGIDQIKSIYTIHNLKYQGLFPKGILGDMLDLDDGYYVPDCLEFKNNISFMKAGIIYSDIVTTVSPNYANEIQNDYYGEGLGGLMKSINSKLHGIVNGIDYDLYDPEVDTLIYHNYSAENIKNKSKNKVFLQKLSRLKQDENIPVIAMVTRLVEEKGLDLFSHIINELMQENIQFIVLGTGNKKYEDMMKTFESYYPEKFSANIYFDNQLAQKIYAGADMFLMPSQIEPCGIGQLIAMRYGTLPIVRKAGGLKDTVEPYNKYSKEGTGFAFLNFNAHELLYTIKDALNLYNDERELWNDLVKNAMKQDLSWVNSAKKYMELYESLLK